MKIFILALLVTTTNVCFSQYWSSATPYDDPNESVLAIEVHNGEIYIGGAFSQVGGILASHIAKWDGTKWKKRGEDYEIKKEEFAQRLLKHLYKQLPQLKGSVEYYEFSTPLTAEHFSNYKQGSLYGIDHNPNRFQQKFLKPKTPVKGLYLTGQDIVTAGVGAALFSGLITAGAITGINFIKRIFNE